MRTAKIASILTVTSALLCHLSVFAAEQPRCKPWTVDKKHRIFVATDISNEPDDAMSLIRMLVHSDQYHIEGIAAVTSTWLNASTYPDHIEEIINAYALVQDNLQTHGHGQFPTADTLLSKVTTGPKMYGLTAIESLQAGNNSSPGAQLLLAAVDASPEPLYAQAWGGANLIAEALWVANATKTPSEFAIFTSKLRVYSISDQDNTGAWARMHFPGVRWIASVHGWNAYAMAAWTGISGEDNYSQDKGGPDTSLVSPSWLAEHVQIGPLGTHYPDVLYIMEGDTPSLFYTFNNGLGNPEFPAWGSWGGRYTPSMLGGNHYGDNVDTVLGHDGRMYTSNKATVWRWRAAYQWEMAARMQWTLQPYVTGSNTIHPPVVVINGSCGSHHIELTAKAGSTITLDATDSYDLDGSTLEFTWFHYREPSMTQNSYSEVPLLNFTFAGGSNNRIVSIQLPAESDACRSPTRVNKLVDAGVVCQQYHLILQATNQGTTPITRYRRVLVKTDPGNGM
ncbi:DUF1593-domain-containing protein [Pseudovirgaria hyperparasitica]|uniref:DUF1593-domain-containing protein n=1 Tax=Pseudovirgaria hyperparasitica TaxID=470096 RepID=A0A6A6WAL9_9PEZI|nr:DUF1593-domain-containing protein [Pseudovirgaria hyperparasitica]KAF2759219.1 DUF1593-domain-containing protein [Pseudovirgaria hyperparasitica]